MKFSLIALFCCLLYSAGAQPQTGWQWGRNKGSQVPPPPPRTRYVHRLDTVPVWRIVVDTSDRVGVSYPTGRPARVIKLLEVREWHNTREGIMDWGACMNCTWSDYPKHITYLLRSHMALPFSWIVFEDELLPEGTPEVAQVPEERDPEGPPDSLLEKWRQLSGENPVIIRGGDLMTHIDTIVGLTSLKPLTWTSLTPDAGAGVKKSTTKTGEELISMDWQWMPRRLKKRFMKFYHIKP